MMLKGEKWKQNNNNKAQKKSIDHFLNAGSQRAVTGRERGTNRERKEQ